MGDWNNLETQVNQKNANIEQKADQHVATLYQGQTVSEADKALTRKNYIENNSAYIITDTGIKSYRSSES